MATRKTTTDLAGRSDQELMALPYREFVKALGYEPMSKKRRKDDPVDLSDHDFVDALRGGRDGGEVGVPTVSADLSGTTGGDDTSDMTDEQIYQGYLSELSGEAQFERTAARLEGQRKEMLGYWQGEHEKGNPIPRDIEEEILEQGAIA